MSKRTILILVTAVFVACASALAPIVKVRAQSLPATKNLQWDQPDATTAGVSGYTMTFDGAVTSVPPCTPDPTKCSVAVTFTTAGTHTFSVVATNAWGNSPSATLTVNVVVPGKSQNLVIK